MQLICVRFGTIIHERHAEKHPHDLVICVVYAKRLNTKVIQGKEPNISLPSSVSSLVCRDKLMMQPTGVAVCTFHRLWQLFLKD